MMIAWLALLCATSALAQTTPLTPGAVVFGSVEQDATALYSVAVADGEEKDLTVTVTPIFHGDPDLFVSFTNENPDADDNLFSAQGFGQDSVTVPKSKYPAGTDRKLFISVAGWRDANFTIVASFKSRITLENGRPQAGTVTTEEMSYYTFVIPASEQSVTFSMTVLSGEAGLFVSNSTSEPIRGDASSYQWRTWFGPHMLPVDSTSADWPTGPGARTFTIGVLGMSDWAFYTVVASYGAAHVQLRDGVPFSDHIDSAGEAEFFKFNVPQSAPGESCSLSLSLTHQYGDPDLYASTTVENPTPLACLLQSCKRANTLGDDHILVKNATAGDWFIGVVAFTNTSFTLLPIVTCTGGRQGVVSLANGVPQTYALGSDDKMFFYFDVNANSDVTVAAIEAYGDPDLYVNVLPAGASAPLPTRFHHFRSSNNFGRDALVIGANDLQEECGAAETSCRVVILVYAYSETQFTLTASAAHAESHPRPITLQDGRRVRGFAESGGYAYYAFTADFSFPLQSVEIHVNEVGERGDPDLYVSTTATARYFADGTPVPPNRAAGNYTWRSALTHGDYLTIPYTDMHVCYRPCQYLIAVYAYGRSNVTFDLIAQLMGTVHLSAGVQYPGALEREELRYYDISVLLAAEEVTFSLVSQTGWANLFVSSNGSLPLPTDSSTYERNTAFFQSIGTVRYQNLSASCANPQFGGCYFTLAVYGRTDTTYTLSAYTGARERQVQELSPGVPVQGHIDTDEYAYFSVRVSTPDRILRITVTPSSGDPDVYSASPSANIARPNRTHNDQASRHLGGDEILYANTEVGVYTIGVEAYISATFSLVAELLTPEDRTALPLLDGNPTAVSISPIAGSEQSNWRYFKFEMFLWSDLLPFIHASLTFRVTPSRGAHPELFVSYNDSAPGFDNHNRGTTRHSMDNSVPVTRPEQGTYFVGVYCASNCSFAMSAFTNMTYTMLMDGVAVRDSVGYKETVFYQFPIFALDLFNNQPSLTIAVERLSGDPDLYVSTQHQYPNASNAMWHAEAWRDDAVTIPYDRLETECFWGCTFYIGVFGYQASTYAVSASLRDSFVLGPDVPVSGSVRKEEMVYYSFSVATTSEPLTVALIPRTGNPNLYISVGWSLLTNRVIRPVRGDESTYSWKSDRFFTSDSVEIPAAELARECASKGQPGPGCQLVIGVYGSGGATSTFSVVASQGVRELSVGVPVSSFVTENEFDYYRFTLATDADLYFILTTTSGDPDLYISKSVVRPNATTAGHDWSSRHFGSDLVHIPNAAPRTYYVAVFGYSANSTYSLYARVWDDARDQTSRIQAGRSLDAFAPAGKYVYFRYVFDNEEDGVADLRISVHALVGDPDVYVNYFPLGSAEETKPTRQAHDFKSESWKDDTLDLPGARTGVYVIAVYAASSADASFSITVQREGAHVMLAEGVPFVGSVDRDEIMYFVLPVTSFADDMTISLNSLNGGDPDMYVSSVHPYPNQTHSEFASRDYLDDIIQIPAGELSRSTRWYIAVEGYNNATFSLTASYSPIRQLTTRAAQVGSLARSEAHHYELVVPLDAVAIAVTATPLSGATAVFVGFGESFPDADTAEWSSYGYEQPSSITIDRDIVDGEGRWCPNRVRDCEMIGLPLESCSVACVYKITVQGFTVGTVYEIRAVASSLADVTALSDGVPLTAGVRRHEYRYFSFQAVSTEDRVLMIDVAPLSGGDPDLYVNEPPLDASTKTPKPNRTRSDFQGSSFGGDIVHVDNDRLRLGTYMIGVYGFYTAGFRITAELVAITPSASHFTDIAEGRRRVMVLQGGQVTRRVFRWRISPNDTRTDSINVNTRYGSVNVMAVRGSDARGPPSNHDCPAEAGCKRADSRGLIEFGDGCSSQCFYWIAVESNSDAMFSISVFRSAQRMLLALGEESPTFDLPADEYRFFEVRTSEEHSPLTVSLAIIGGDPDIVISKRNPTPTFTPAAGYPPLCPPGAPDIHTCDLSDRSLGATILTIPDTGACDQDARRRGLDYCNNFYIGVLGWSSSVFSIRADSALVRLSIDRQYASQLRPGQSVFLAFHMARQRQDLQDLLIDITSPSASIRDLVMFASTRANVTAGRSHETLDLPNWLTPASAQWSSLDTDVRGRIQIDAESPAACNRDWNCIYYIGVRHTGAPEAAAASFRVSASFGDSVLLLQQGSPRADELQSATEPKRYQVIVGKASKRLQVSLTPYLGDLQLFVGKTKNVGEGNSIWRSERVSASTGRGIALVIDDAEFRALVADRSATLYIAVKGRTAQSSYAISASSSALEIFLGQSSTGSLTGTEGQRFFFHGPLYTSSIEIIPIGLTESGERRPEETFTLTLTKHRYNADKLPGHSDVLTHELASTANPLTLTTSSDMYCSGESCVYYLGVFLAGDAATDGKAHNFQVLVQDEWGMRRLNLPDSRLGTVQLKHMQYYELHVPTTKFEVILETCTGNADLFAAQGGRLPSEEWSQWQSSQRNHIDSIRFGSGPDGFTGRAIDIGVLGADQSSYTLSAYALLDPTHPEAPPEAPDKENVVAELTSTKGSVKLSWSAVDAPGAVYHAYLVEESVASAARAAVYTECGLKTVTEPIPVEGGGSVQDGVHSFVVKGLKVGSTYVFNVVATKSERTFVYTQAVLAVKTPSSGSAKVGLVVGITVPLICIVISVAAALWWKNRKLSKELELDIEDVPRAAVRKAVYGGGGPTEPKKAKKYSRLLVDEDAATMQEDEFGGLGRPVV